MAGSIRRRLLLLLTIMMLVGWCIASVWTYLHSRREIAQVYDATLAQTARVVQRLLTLTPGMLRSNVEEQEITLDPPGETHPYESQIAFLARDADGRHRFRSPGAPDLPVPEGTGFRDVELNGTFWRVFVLCTPGLIIQTAERQAVRGKLVHLIALNTLAPLLLVMPLIIAVTWLGVGGGLRPLRQVARAVARRNPESLVPLDTTQVPREALPLVDAMNALSLRLDEAVERERHFTADAAHELRTPLTALKAQLQAALRANDPATRARALQQVEQGVDRATRLLEQLLTLARMDAAPPTPVNAASPMDLRVVAAETVAMLVPVALRRGVDVDLELSDESGNFTVPGDPGSSAILLRNLIDNAVRHSPAPGQVTVALDSRPEVVNLCVLDQGPGIPASERDAVFQRFLRGEHDGPGGSGLGLSIAQRIAELHDTRVLLQEGPEGIGLKACVAFPRTRL